MWTPAHLVPFLRELLRDRRQPDRILPPYAVKQRLLALYAAADPDLASHVHRTAFYARHLSRVCCYGEPLFLDQIELGGLLHDLGKLALPRELLVLPRALTLREWEHFRRHPALALELLSGLPLSMITLDAIAHHHERWSGTGYPCGLAGERIPLSARLVGLCDTFDAVTTARPHRPALSPELARAELDRAEGSQLDPELAAAARPHLERAFSALEAGLRRLTRPAPGEDLAGVASSPLPRTVAADPEEIPL